jgi:hypothetical protein
MTTGSAIFAPPDGNEIFTRNIFLPMTGKEQYDKND